MTWWICRPFRRHGARLARKLVRDLERKRAREAHEPRHRLDKKALKQRLHDQKLSPPKES